MSDITPQEIRELFTILTPLLNVQFEVLNIPKEILIGFDPSQIGTIVGVLMDACIPQLSAIIPNNKLLSEIGLIKSGRILKDREGYPDYEHISGKRAELKLLYVDPIDAEMKKPSTPREASARISQKVTVKNVLPATDVLLLIAYQLQPNKVDHKLYSPTIIDIGVFSMIDCIRARDNRLLESGGKWFGNYDTPVILSKQGKRKIKDNETLDETTYGRKEDEKKDYNEDTNFGKLNRIPLASLQEFLKKFGYKVPIRRKIHIGKREIVVEEGEQALDDVYQETLFQES